MATYAIEANRDARQDRACATLQKRVHGADRSPYIRTPTVDDGRRTAGTADMFLCEEWRKFRQRTFFHYRDLQRFSTDPLHARRRSSPCSPVSQTRFCNVVYRGVFFCLDTQNMTIFDESRFEFTHGTCDEHAMNSDRSTPLTK